MNKCASKPRSECGNSHTQQYYLIRKTRKCCTPSPEETQKKCKNAAEVVCVCTLFLFSTAPFKSICILH